MPPNQQNPYDFITNPAPAPRRSFNFGNSMGARVAVVAVILIVLIVLYMIASSFLNSGDKAQAQRLTDVAKAQNEMIRLSTLADSKAKSDTTKAYALTIKYSMQSSQLQVKKLLANRGVNEKGISKTLSASKNTKSDAALDEGARNNRYDETYRALMEQQLVNYQKLLQAAHGSGTANEKKTLTATFESSKVLAAKPTKQ